MTGYLKLRSKVLGLLRNELPEDLCYHGIAHTLDVLGVCNEYIRREGLEPEEAKLLRTGALCHDLGFTVDYHDHEEHGASLAKEIMAECGYPEEYVKLVTGLIKSTKVPQSPRTKLERILCDADLDYLGREDYDRISGLLLKELKRFGLELSAEEWRQKQISFLENHQYHTDFAQKYREPVKDKHLQKIRGQRPV
jgi:HD superfamily phosphodiesterase